MKLTIGLLWVAALALAGCGGEDPTAAERFRAEANAICARAATEVEAVLTDDGGARERADRVRAILARSFERLGALRPPPELAAAHARLRDAGRGMIALGKAGRASPEHGNALRGRYDELARDGEAAMAQLGITGC